MEIKSKYRTSMVNGDIILEIEADYKEAIKALKLDVETFDVVKEFMGSNKSIDQMQQRRINIIEKAYGESWEDIRWEK